MTVNIKYWKASLDTHLVSLRRKIKNTLLQKKMKVGFIVETRWSLCAEKHLFADSIIFWFLIRYTLFSVRFSNFVVSFASVLFFCLSSPPLLLPLRLRRPCLLLSLCLPLTILLLLLRVLLQPTDFDSSFAHCVAESTAFPALLQPTNAFLPMCFRLLLRMRIATHSTWLRVLASTFWGLWINFTVHNCANKR